MDLFKFGAMKAYWAEDYIFSVPESPQIISWMFATMHCGAKYNHQPLHPYIMPHAPGQTPENLRRNQRIRRQPATGNRQPNSSYRKFGLDLPPDATVDLNSGSMFSPEDRESLTCLVRIKSARYEVQRRTR